MIFDVEVVLAGEFTLTLLDDFIVKLNHLASFDADHVVMVFIGG